MGRQRGTARVETRQRLCKISSKLYEVYIRQGSCCINRIPCILILYVVTSTFTVRQDELCSTVSVYGAIRLLNVHFRYDM
jgi:hypothetical protein